MNTPKPHCAIVASRGKDAIERIDSEIYDGFDMTAKCVEEIAGDGGPYFHIAIIRASDNAMARFVKCDAIHRLFMTLNRCVQSHACIMSKGNKCRAMSIERRGGVKIWLKSSKKRRGWQRMRSDSLWWTTSCICEKTERIRSKEGNERLSWWFRIRISLMEIAQVSHQRVRRDM